MHFALNCASIGCPPLRSEPYEGRRIDEQLELQARDVHARRRWVHHEPDAGVVWLTKVYDWYRGDFEQTAGGIAEHVSRYVPSVAHAIRERDPLSIRWMDYDWSLNSADNQRRRAGDERAHR